MHFISLDYVVLSKKSHCEVDVKKVEQPKSKSRITEHYEISDISLVKVEILLKNTMVIKVDKHGSIYMMGL